TLSVADIVAKIKAAFPGNAAQQPYSVETKADPLDPARSFLAFRTFVDGSGDPDPGFVLLIGGTARNSLGLIPTGRIAAYEPEAFGNGHAVAEGYNAYAEGLPSNTDLKSEFDARMFVAMFVGDDHRAGYNRDQFDIKGAVFQDQAYFTGTL